MTTVNIAYATKATITCTLASLGTSSSFVAGRESTEIDNSSNKYDDAMVNGYIAVGTTPTTNTQIIVYVLGAQESFSTAGVDVFDGTDSAETVTSAGLGNAFLRIGSVITVDAATSNVKYPFNIPSIAEVFNGVMPKFWELFIAHNTVAALNATGSNHLIEYTGITYTNA